MVWLLVSAPTCCTGVDWSYSVVEAPGPRSLGSSPYSKYAVVATPSGSTEADNAATLLVWLLGAPPDTAGGAGPGGSEAIDTGL